LAAGDTKGRLGALEFAGGGEGPEI